MSFGPEWTETSALMAAIAGLGGGQLCQEENRSFLLL